MKKRKSRWIAWLILLALMLSLTVTVTAEATKSCVITAESVAAKAGEQVTVAVSISENPGFTNFGIALDYDREKLEQFSLTPAELWGEMALGSTAWNPAQDEQAKNHAAFEQTKTYGYVVCASETQITGNGTLFSAVFQVKDSVNGTAAVTPIVGYIRDNTALFSFFAPVNAEVTAGIVTIEEGTVLYGDVNGDGRINSTDAAITYAVHNGKRAFTAEQAVAGDVNGDGKINSTDAALIYAVHNGKRKDFPVESMS